MEGLPRLRQYKSVPYVHLRCWYGRRWTQDSNSTKRRQEGHVCTLRQQGHSINSGWALVVPMALGSPFSGAGSFVPMRLSYGNAE